jgi:hypothetical protein
MRRGLAALAIALAGCSRKPASETDDLAAFRRAHPFDDASRWVSLEVSRSTVTEMRRRIHFEKEAVTRALLAHEGGRGDDAARMRYPDGTVFVAESLADDGSVRDTEVLRVRPETGAMFLLFDRDGKRTFTFARPTDGAAGPTPGNVPAVCVNCHIGSELFEPMLSFPAEPPDRRLLVDETYRNAEIVARFQESRHRGDALFGPYGALWLSRLAAAGGDAPFADRLREKYPDVLGAAKAHRP